MANKTLIFLITFLLVFTTFTSALVIVDDSPDLGNEKVYVEDYGDYGKILITDTFDEDLAEYILLESKSSIINSMARGQTELFQVGKILDNVYFENIIGQEEFLSGTIINIWEITEEEVTIGIDNWTCSDVITSNETYDYNLAFNRTSYDTTYILEHNDTNIVYPEEYNSIVYNAIYYNESLYNESQCSYGETSSYNITNILTSNPIEYNFENYPIGVYGWEIKTDKSFPNQILDWIILAKQKLFTEWAWWNSLWGWSQNITITSNGTASTNTWVEIVIPEDGNKNQVNFTDSRFTNSEEPFVELNYTIPEISGSSATFYVEVPSIPSSGDAVIIHYYNSTSSESSGTSANPSFETFSYTLETPEQFSDVQGFSITENNTEFNSLPFRLECQGISGYGVNKLRLFIDGSQYSERDVSGNDASYEFYISNLLNGEYTWYCEAEDDYGISSSDLRNFELDSVSPTLTITELVYDVDDNNLPVQAVVRSSVSDVNLDYCKYRTTEMASNEFVNFTCGSDIVYDFEEFGFHTITIYAYDTFGHYSSKTTDTLEIADNNPPTIMVESPVGTADLLTSIVLLKTVTDEEATCSYKINGGSLFAMNQSNDGLTQQAIISPSTNTFTIQFVCEDIFGNGAESEVVSHQLAYVDSSVESASLSSVNITLPTTLVAGLNIITVKTLDQYNKPISVQKLTIDVLNVADYTIGQAKSIAGKIGEYQVEVYLPELTVDNLEISVTTSDGNNEITASEEGKYSLSSNVAGLNTVFGNFTNFISNNFGLISGVFVLGIIIAGSIILFKKSNGEHGESKSE